MRKMLIALFAVAVLGAGSALAQDMSVQYDTTQWAGVGLGYPFQVYYGIDNAVGQDLDLRVRVSSYFWNVSLGADILTPITTIENMPITVYAGGGPNVDYLFSAGLGIGVSGLVGAEYRFNQDYGAFLELGAGYTYYFGDLTGLNYFGLGFQPRGALGFNYHF